MNGLIVWLQAHQILIWWVVSNCIFSMPSPDPASSKFYRWFFGTSHSIMGNLPRAIQTRVNGTANEPAKV